MYENRDVWKTRPEFKRKIPLQVRQISDLAFPRVSA